MLVTIAEESPQNQTERGFDLMFSFSLSMMGKINFKLAEQSFQQLNFQDGFSYCLKRRTWQILAQNFDFLFFLFGQACLEAYKQSSPDDSESKIQFQRAFANILGDVQSIIDSPHTRKEKREKIVALCENAQDIMKDILERQKNNKVSLYLYPQF